MDSAKHTAGMKRMGVKACRTLFHLDTIATLEWCQQKEPETFKVTSLLEFLTVCRHFFPF